MHQHLVAVIVLFSRGEVAEHGFRAAGGKIGHIFGVKNEVLQVQFLQAGIPQVIDNFRFGRESVLAGRFN